ncbi:serine/threonine-protein kinase [Salinactinospora qingdaonensis]|uniref:non-specific serine/threonine protein kinase n=1 Tax=Salinactinospora qingdaonensis TaxID=702744 RepID=A0ABP7FJW9_9ACTN
MGPLENGDPERVGRYRLIGRLGAGGMGQVFFGRSAGGRAVAVKRIHPHLATDTSFRQRFAREITAARQVSGAFTAPVIDADPEGEVPWLVTSYVPSLPLNEAVGKLGPLPEHSLRVLAAGLAEALVEIHRVGLIHRDLKPGNVLLADEGPRVIDFGIARATEGTAATQSVIGTPGFMSPEQVQGQELTPKSDMFAFGAVLVYAAAGVGPFGEGSVPTMVMRVMQEDPDVSGVPQSLRRLVNGCLTKDARYRPGPGDVLDFLGDVPIGDSWLPPAFMRGVQEQVAKVNAALSAAPAGADADAATVALGAVSTAATERLVEADGEPMRAKTWQSSEATSAMGSDSGRGAVAPSAGGDAGLGGAGRADVGSAGGEGGAGRTAPTAAMPPGVGDGGAGAPVRRGPGEGDRGYEELYRGSRSGEDERYREGQEERRRAEWQREEQRRRREQQDRWRREEAERQRRDEEERRRAAEESQRRRREDAERVAHEERMRAERAAVRRDGPRWGTGEQPGLWSFVKLLPFLVIPLIQLPLGWGVSLGLDWMLANDVFWRTDWWRHEPFFTGPGFVQALLLGYFVLNNLIAVEYLVRSLRRGFVTGVVLAVAVSVGTNGALWSFGFFS